MPRSHTFQYTPINHHHLTCLLIYTHRYHSLSLRTIPLKCPLSSFSPWLWAPSVTVVLQGRRDGVWCWMVACGSHFWFHHRCACLVLSLLHFAEFHQNSFFINLGHFYCNTVDMAYSSDDLQYYITIQIVGYSYPKSNPLEVHSRVRM